MKPIGVGVIGTGFMGKAHSIAYSASASVFGTGLRPKLEIVCVSGQDTLRYYKSVSNSSSFGENPFTINFSIPQNYQVAELHIRWPNGAEQTLKELKPMHLNIVSESDNKVQYVKLNSFKSSDIKAVHDHQHH